MFEKSDTPVEIDAADQYGTTVAAWGDYAIAASTQYSDGGISIQGAVVVYRRNEVTLELEQHQVLTSPTPIDSGRFGDHIDICRKHIIVVERGSDLFYVYERDNANQWVLFDTETLANVNSVACAGDYFALGTFDTITFYRKAGNALVADGSLVTTVTNIGFGDKISMDMNGDVEPYLITGATLMDDGGTVDKGAAFIYKRTGESTWTLEDLIRGSETGANDQFGFDVEIEDDVAVVIRNTEGGFLYVFERNPDNSGQWTEVQRRGSVGGTCLALSQRYIVVGAVVSNEGRFRTYNNDGTYAQQGFYPPTDYSEVDNTDTFAESCAITHNGHLVLGNRLSTSLQGTDSGAVEIFREVPGSIGGFRDPSNGIILCDAEWDYRASAGATIVNPDSDGCLDRFDASTQPFQHDTPDFDEASAIAAIDSNIYSIDTNRWCSHRVRRCSTSGATYRPDAIASSGTCTDGELRRSWGYCVQRKAVVVTDVPTSAPSVSPTISPSLSPSTSPSANPSLAPTLFPTQSPTTPAPTFAEQCSCPRR